VTVTALSVGQATITATSETKTATSPVITVIPPPVTTVTLSALTTPAGFGTTQQLTATPKDFAGNTLIGRTVGWVSSNAAVLMVSAPSSVSTASGATVMVTAVGVGHATITATSETKTATTLQITVNPLSGTAATLLSRSIQNPRYFQNESGQAVYLTGSHTWSNMQDNGTVDPPPSFNYSAYLDFLTARNHNFFILWAWEQSKWTAEIASDYWISPGPFKRVGPAPALDGKPKFDLNQFDQAYFDRLRNRVQEAGAHGMYVAVMLFDGWSVGAKGDEPLNNPWKGHPFNASNNINGIDGDTDHDGNGLEVQTLGNGAVTALQDAYVRKVIDAVGDLDNVLYEIDNEGDPSSKTWQYHMIQVIRDYEATKGKQHPIGMTAMYPEGNYADLTTSDADWISTTGLPGDPITANGAKVLISDTDHLCGICGTVDWVWKTFTKGQNPILMDGYDGLAVGLGSQDYTSTDPIWETLRKNMGFARSYALRMDLASAVPHGDLVLSEETGYSLAKPGSQYLVFLPNGGGVTLNLSAVSGSLNYEWFNPATGLVTQTGTVTGGASVVIPGPSFSGASVLFVH
jgi:hypothetical protein